MSGPLQVLIALLSSLLITSIGLNVCLFEVAHDNSVQSNTIRLDPLGLNAYPPKLSPAIDPTNKAVIVFLGDSRAAAWPAPTPATSATFINRGIGAETTAQALGRLPFHVIPLKPSTIVIQVGINDLMMIPLAPAQKKAIVEDCKANIHKIVDLSVQSGARVILTTIFPLGRPPILRRLFWSNDIELAIIEVNRFIAATKVDKVTVIDTARILANNDGVTKPEYTKDFLHLNREGYEALNRELIRHLRL